MTLTGSDTAIGLIGPFYPDTHPEPELGWSLWDLALEGRGFAFEAACAARDWFFANTTHRTAVSYTSPENHRSHRLCERMGAVLAAKMAVEDSGGAPTLAKIRARVSPGWQRAAALAAPLLIIVAWWLALREAIGRLGN